MRNYLIWLLVCASFAFGLGIGKVSFSKIIRETKEVNVYGLPEGINLNELCDGYYGSYANELKEKAETNAYNYEQGMKEGIKKVFP